MTIEHSDRNSLTINEWLSIPLDDIEWQAVRAQGAGGQNVNKVSSAVHLRFDIPASSLPPAIRERLLEQRDRRLTKEGVLVIKSQQHRRQDRNREDALQRLREFISEALIVQKTRRATRPSRGSVARRLESKTRHKRLKQSHGKIDW